LTWYGIKYNEIIRRTARFLYRKNDGHRILDEDWDHMILLDACRFDMFHDAVKAGKVTLDGRLETRTSRGSTTEEWLRENFDPKKKYDDIVYVSSNPHIEKYFGKCFNSIHSVWIDGWDDGMHTVLPETMTRRALRAYRENPDKRLIVHYIQPHFPFIPLGSVGDLGLEKFREAVIEGEDEFDNPTIWRLLEEGKVTRKDVEWGYRKNLEAVLPHAEELARALKGRIVITSDHGNALGERYHPLVPMKIFGHHWNIRIDGLVKVPWYVYESEGRSRDSIEKDVLGDKISDLIKDKLI